jgi:hypothetical protein
VSLLIRMMFMHASSPPFPRGLDDKVPLGKKKHGENPPAPAPALVPREHFHSPIVNLGEHLLVSRVKIFASTFYPNMISISSDLQLCSDVYISQSLY